MIYNEDSLNEITKEYDRIPQINNQLFREFYNLNLKLTNDKAKEYLTQGVARRLKIITRCIENIFQIFPIRQTDHLTQNQLTDLSINLHAFFVNISGLFDNLGWVFAFEYDLVGEQKKGKLSRNDIGIFYKETQTHLSDRLSTYLKSQDLQDWYSKYSKNYRDALAHRIPLYVPPALLTPADELTYRKLQAQLQTLDPTKHDDLKTYDDIEAQQRQLGQASPFFAHSIGEKGKPVHLHAQVIVDYKTIEEVITKFCKFFEPNKQLGSH